MKRKSNYNNELIIPMKEAKIPYSKLKGHKIIKFIIITTDNELLTDCIKIITEFQQQHKNLKITVFISSSYEKLHKMSKGKL